MERKKLDLKLIPWFTSVRCLFVVIFFSCYFISNISANHFHPHRFNSDHSTGAVMKSEMHILAGRKHCDRLWFRAALIHNGAPFVHAAAANVRGYTTIRANIRVIRVNRLGHQTQKSIASQFINRVAYCIYLMPNALNVTAVSGYNASAFENGFCGHFEMLNVCCWRLFVIDISKRHIEV